MAERRHKKRKFRHETQIDRDELVTVLEDLLAGVRAGELVLGDGDETLTLRPQGPIVLELQARRKSGRASIELALAWRPPPTAPTLRIGETTISGPEPEPPLAELAPAAASSDDGDDPELVAPPAWSQETLARLPKTRLYALARAVGLEGRSQLHKRALAQALSECDLRPHLDDDELA